MAVLAVVLLVVSIAGVTSPDAEAATTAKVAAAATAPALPAVPFVASVTSQGLGVLVSWAPDAASDAVTGYKVSVAVAAGTPTPAAACQGPFAVSTDASQSAALVSGLCAKVAYQATVAATNAAGTSPASSPYGPVVALAAQVPATPLVTGVYAREKSLLVAWAAPATDGGSAVTGYTVTATPKSGAASSVSAPGSARSLMVTGLRDGTSYSVALVATNAIGQSLGASSSGTPAAAHVATAPVGVSAAPDGTGRVGVSWTAPADNGGSAIKGYTVSWQQVGQAKAGAAYKPVAGAVVRTAAVGGSTLSYTVAASKFRPAAALYAISVTATNSSGASVAGTPTSPVSPVTSVKSATTVLTAATMSDLSSDTPTATGSTLVWAAPAPAQIAALTAGSVVVAKPGGAATQGLLDTVTAVKTASDGSITLTTKTAALTDVFTSLALSSSSDPASSTTATVVGLNQTPSASVFHPAEAGIRMLAPVTAAAGKASGDPQASVSVGLDDRLAVDYAPSDSAGAFVSGEVDVNPQLSLTVNIDHGYAGVPNGVNLTSTALVKATASVNVGFKTRDDWTTTLGELDGAPVDIQVGPVPVVVVPKIVVQFSADGQIANTVSESMTVGGSLSWDSQHAGVLTVKNLSSVKDTGGWLPKLAVTGEGTAKLVFQPQLDFYDVAGPNFQPSVGAVLDADLNPDPGDPYLKIAPFVQLDAGLDLDLLGKHTSLEVQLTRVLFGAYTLVHGPAPTLTVTPSSATLAPGKTLSLTAARPGGGTGTLTWSLANQAGDTISAAGVFTAAAPAGRSVTIDVEDSGGAVGTAVVDVGTAPFNPVQSLTATLSTDKTAATLSWTPPAATGGSPLAHYVVISSAGGQAKTVTSTSDTITGLIPGRAYTVTVYAVASNGRTSPPATSVVPSTATAGLVATALVSGDDGVGSCALLSGGTADCWGINDHGDLGNGTTTNSDVPVKVSGLTGATALVGSDDGYCALLSGGTAECWGSNHYGELGNGITADSDVPVMVSGLTGATALVSSDFGYCALLSGGTAECWGSNGNGALGNGTTTNSDVPVKVSGLTGATALVGSDLGYCALLSGGTADCWGDNHYGVLGNGTTTDSHVPVKVSGLTGATALVSGGNDRALCALLSGGTADCWGYNGNGQLGNGTTTDSHVPVKVSGLTGATALVGDGDRYCALLSGGTADCWGYNGNGQLGNGITTDSDVPVKVSGLTGATALVSGGDGSCALLSGGTADCWGYNGNGQLGNGITTDSDVPVKVSGLTGATALVADGDGYCALLSGGTADCWGYNHYGEIGNGTTTDSDVPVKVAPFM